MENSWQLGSASATTGAHNGLDDPGSDNTATSDNGVIGVNLGGFVPKVVHDFHYVLSPVIDTSASSSPLHLEFYRWLNSDAAPFMENKIDVFDGVTWQNIWTQGSVADSAWNLQQFDITAHSNASLQVRFGYSMTNAAIFNVGGWNIDDVSISEVPEPTTSILSLIGLALFAGRRNRAE